MKKIIFILLVVFAVSGCDHFQDLYFLAKIGDGFDLYYHEDFEKLKSITQITEWVNSNIEYEKDAIGSSWQSPEETLKRGFGDCEDIAILLINIIYVSLGVKTDLVCNDVNNRKIVNGGKVNHAEIHYNGTIYDIYTAKPMRNVNIGFMYTFDVLILAR